MINHNRQLAFLPLAMPIAAAVSTINALNTPQRPSHLVALGVLVIYAGAIVATTSRMGIALLPVP